MNPCTEPPHWTPALNPCTEHIKINPFTEHIKINPFDKVLNNHKQMILYDNPFQREHTIKPFVTINYSDLIMLLISA